MTMDEAIAAIRSERIRQLTRWSTFHDRQHSNDEWARIIHGYASGGQWKEVAALAIAAMEAQS